MIDKATAAKHAADWLSAGVAVATVVQWLPPIAALFTLIYTAMRMFDWIEARIARRASPPD